MIQINDKICYFKALLYEIQGNRILCQSNTEKLNHSESVRFLDLNSITVFSPKCNKYSKYIYKLKIYSKKNNFLACFDRNKPECTSLEQVNCVTICYIAKYKENSNCSCVITGNLNKIAYFDKKKYLCLKSFLSLLSWY